MTDKQRIKILRAAVKEALEVFNLSDPEGHRADRRELGYGAGTVQKAVKQLRDALERAR